MRTFAKVSTPWGLSDGCTTLAPGIEMHSTPGHGVIRLATVERRRAFYERFPSFRTFSGAAQWFEEDCDAAAVVLAFADEFENDEVYNAVRSVKCSAAWEAEGRPLPRGKRGWADIVEWLDSNDLMAMSIRSRCERVQAEVSNKWERGSMGSCGPELPVSCWEVGLRRGDERKWVTFADYPTQQWYTDEEVEAATYKSEIEQASV